MTDIETETLLEIRRIISLAKAYPPGSIGRNVCDQEVAASTAALVNGDEAAMRTRLAAMSSMCLTAA